MNHGTLRQVRLSLDEVRELVRKALMAMKDSGVEPEAAMPAFVGALTLSALDGGATDEETETALLFAFQTFAKIYHEAKGTKSSKLDN